MADETEDDYLRERVAVCNHVSFQANVDVRRRPFLGRFKVAVTVRCKDCGGAFRFLGLPPMDPTEPDGIGTEDEGFVAVIPIAPRYGPMAGMAERFLSSETAAARILHDLGSLSEDARDAVLAAIGSSYCMNCYSVKGGRGCTCMKDE